jgi:hypothetical protein
VLARKEFDEELETSGYNRKHTLQNIYNRNPNSIILKFLNMPNTKNW